MNAENMARAMLFVSFLAASILVGLFTFIYAAHCFLTTVQQSAAGNDRIRWPNEPLYDKLPRALYLACFIVIWIAPAGLLLRLNPDRSIGESPLLTFFTVAVILLWAFFPLGLFSALSSSSPWTLFRPAVLASFLARFGETVAFYFVTALLLGGSLGLLYLAFATGSIICTFTVPLAVAAAFLIYARLLGRMAYVFDQLPTGKRRTRPRARPESREVGKARKKATDTANDPWAVPDEPRKPRKKKRKTVGEDAYAMADEDVAAPTAEEAKPKRRVKTYRLADEPPVKPPMEIPADGYVPVGYEAIPPSERKSDAEEPSGSDFDRSFREKPTDEDPPPARPLLDGVYSFPWYPDNIVAWILLSFGGIIMCGLIQLMLHFLPT
jgi:hypothetical protein